MLSVSKLSPGQEAYYERSVAAGIDDYYAGRGESPGVWVGRGAVELELDGVVGDGELGRLDQRAASAHVHRTAQACPEEADHSRADRPGDWRALPRGADPEAGRGI